jgi:hypothetical protein
MARNVKDGLVAGSVSTGHISFDTYEIRSKPTGHLNVSKPTPGGSVPTQHLPPAPPPQPPSQK